MEQTDSAGAAEANRLTQTQAHALALKILELNATKSPVDFVARSSEVDRAFGEARGFARKLRRVFNEAESEQTKVAVLRLAAETVAKGADYQEAKIGAADLTTEQLASLLMHLEQTLNDPKLLKPPRETPGSFGV